MSVRGDAWQLFDAVIDGADRRDANPWRRSDTRHTPTGDRPRHMCAYEPDYETLSRLLGVPILLGAPSQSGVPALSLDVWVAYEFRRAGFDGDAIWPRASSPRVLSPDIAVLLSALPKDLRVAVTRRLSASGMGKAASSNANLLGKNYVKQVDVGMSSWRTGPELLVSTKRMDSSFAKNAANRVEESYGDAKNLRLRHPRAALGFVYGLRSTALTVDPDKTEWLSDLLVKLGREDDAYDAVALIVPEWDDTREGSAEGLDDGTPAREDALAAAGLADPPEGDKAVGAEAAAEVDADAEPAVGSRIDAGSRAGGGTTEPADERSLDAVLPAVEDPRLAGLPSVRLRHDAVPYELSPDRFFEVMIGRILDNCPVNFHREARRRLAEAASAGH